MDAILGSGAGTGAPSLATHCESSSHLKSAFISATFSGALHLLAVHRNEKAATKPYAEMF